MNEIFHTSDEHLGHNNIITPAFGNRPWKNMDDMVDGLAEKHNAVVGAGDTVYHHGDMFWRGFGLQAATEYMKRLHGQHHYIFGNHEELWEKDVFNVLGNYFQSVTRCGHGQVASKLTHPFGKGKPGIVCSHYAMRTWYKSHNGYWNLFGHSHGNKSNTHPVPLPNSCDVGVDTQLADFAPVNLETLKRKFGV